MTKGASLLITIIIISAICLAIALSVTLAGIGEIQMGADLAQSDKARAFTEACMDEALLQLIRDPDYSGEDLTLNGGTCNINIDKTGPNPIITCAGSFKQFTKSLRVEFDMANKKILSWQE